MSSPHLASARVREMPVLSPLHPLHPHHLLFGRAPSLPPSLLLAAPSPQTLPSKPLRASTRAPANHRYSAVQSLQSGGANPAPFSENPNSSARIFIKGLSCSTSEGYLAKTFSSFGEICKVKIITSRSSRQSLGLAYIWFAYEDDAQLAVKEMDGKFVDGRFIAVMIAMPEAPSSQARAVPYRF